MPLLFAGEGCSFMDFDGVRALVVLPELPVAGGAVGGAASVVLEELDDCCALAVESVVRALVVLPEFAQAVGFVGFPEVELDVLPESFEALFDFLLLAVLVLPSLAARVSPIGGVALAEGLAAALFFGLLVVVGVVLAFSPSVFPAPSLLVLVLLREEVAEAPEPLVVLSVPAASFESVFFLVLVFLEAVEVSPELACGAFVESVESEAGFFFFFVFVESLCDWSVACADGREEVPCDVLTKPKPSNNAVETAINIANRRFFFIAVLWLCYRLQIAYRGRQANDAAGCAAEGCKSIQERVDSVRYSDVSQERTFGQAGYGGTSFSRRQLGPEEVPSTLPGRGAWDRAQMQVLPIPVRR